MEVKFGKYRAYFVEGGVRVEREERLLYYNKRPLYVLVKTAEAITEFYDAPYQEMILEEGRVTGRGTVVSQAGSCLAFADVYEAAGEGLKIIRKVQVEQAGDDLGFSRSSPSRWRNLRSMRIISTLLRACGIARMSMHRPGRSEKDWTRNTSGDSRPGMRCRCLPCRAMRPGR